jgi:hypothetical protein
MQITSKVPNANKIRFAMSEILQIQYLRITLIECAKLLAIAAWEPRA